MTKSEDRAEKRRDTTFQRWRRRSRHVSMAQAELSLALKDPATVGPARGSALRAALRAELAS